MGCAESTDTSALTNTQPASPTRKQGVDMRKQPSMAALTTHTVHKSTHPAYPARAKVKAIKWSDSDPSYSPVNFTHQVVLENDRTVKQGGWADPSDPKKIRSDIEARGSYCNHGKITFIDGVPRNPIGRTGMIGRGLLGKWGPNYAADPIVTREVGAGSRKYQVVVVERSDTHHWALPGGMVEYDQTVSQTIRREFQEEAGNVPEEDRERVTAMIDQLFSKEGTVVYRGYVDDPRNTDNAWMETTAVHYHCSLELGESLPLAAGDDAVKVRWLDIDDQSEDFKALYSNHGTMILNAYKLLIARDEQPNF